MVLLSSRFLIIFVLHYHEAMLKDFFRRNSLIWMHAQHLIKQVNEFSVTCPFISLEIIAFFESG